MAILFADGFNSYVSTTAFASGGAIHQNGAQSLPAAGYETPTIVNVYSYAGVFGNGGKQNLGNALRICYQVGNSTNYLNPTPADGVVSFKRKFNWHWERFVMLSTQLKLTKTSTDRTVLSRIPLITFGPVTVYVTNDYDAANSLHIYKVYVNDSIQVGRIDSAQWTSLDIEINREEKKLRVWLGNMVVWETDATYFTTQEFEFGGYLKGPSPDYPTATNAVHVGLFDIDSVVIMDGSGTENNVRTSSLGVKTLAPDAFAFAGFQSSNGDGTVAAINDTTLGNYSYDSKFRIGTGAGNLDLLSQSNPGEIQPLAVVLGTISRGVEADSPRVRTAYRCITKQSSGAIKNGKTQLHAGAWRHNKELINQMPDGTVFSVSKLPNFHFGYQTAAPSEFESMVNGAFEYLAFAPAGSDLFTIYRGDADATYIQPGEPEYQVPIPIIPNNGPGPQTLKAGTERLGYFGTVSSLTLFNERALAERLKFVEGEAINPTTPWLKFVNAGKILFIPQKPIRSGVSWQGLYQKGLVYGVEGTGLSPLPVDSPVTQDVKVNAMGQLFRVRLMTGANSDPANSVYNVQDPITSFHSEWSRLIHRVSNLDPTKTFWERFTDAELGVGTDLSLCQETHNYAAGSRVARGFTTALGLAAAGLTGGGGGYSYVWRPVLEYLGPTDPEPEDKPLVDPELVYTSVSSNTYDTTMRTAASDNYLLVPTANNAYKKVSYDDLAVSSVKTAPSNATLAKALLVSDIDVVLGSYGTPTFRTTNDGAGWSQLIASGYTGLPIIFKNDLYIPQTNGQWMKYPNKGTSGSLLTSAVKSSGQYGYGINRNIVAHSTATGASATMLYISWDMVTSYEYNVSPGTNTQCIYIGSNIFLLCAYGGTGISRLLYIPPTQGAPTILKEFASGVVARLLHIKNTLVRQVGTSWYYGKLPEVVDNPDASLAEAQAYAAKMVALIEGGSMKRITDSLTGYTRISFKWRDRLVYFTHQNVYVWDVG